MAFRLFVLIFLSAALAALAMAEDALVLSGKIALPGVEGRIDHLAADIAGQRLFIAAIGNNSVEVLDLKTNQRTGSLSDLPEVQSVVFDPKTNKLFASCGGNGTVRCFDGTTLQQIKSVALGEDADNMRLDTAADRLYVGYGDGAIGVLDAASCEVIPSAKTYLAGHPESFQLASQTSRLFVNVPEAKEIVFVARKSARRFPLEVAGFAGCAGKLSDGI
jgi:DNA-binding beta-propeller fold protein YncE